jgi:hypothetical protein
MPNLSTTVAVYPDLPTALADWAGIVTRASSTAEEVQEALDADAAS